MPKEDLLYDNSAAVNSTGKPILGKLQGPCADIINATRNGRKYSKELWKKVFNDPIVKEYFDCGGVFGELGHPADREETDMEKIAICMSQPPKENADGELIGEWDILNTPNGRIAKCLCDYGYKLGISSRGSGDTYTDMDGNESVDPDSYSFNAFDLVLLPAVKTARLEAVTESLDPKKKIGFKRAINEALQESKEEEKKIMTETLGKLDIDYVPEKTDSFNIEANVSTPSADNDGDGIVKDLQEALKQKQTLESQVTDLQEKLSVCYAKEANQEELIERYKKTVISLSDSAKSAKALSTKVSALTETINAQKKQISESEKVIQSLRESKTLESSRRKSLTESITAKTSQVDKLVGEVKSLQEKLTRATGASKKAQEALQEQLADVKKDGAIKQEEYSKKLTRANSLVEKYKNVATMAVDKYIASQALKLGVESVEIRNRLSEGFTFDDIDDVCESLQEYKLNMSKLPFDVSTGKKLNMRITESKSTALPALKKNDDDEVDSQLKSLAGIK